MVEERQGERALRSKQIEEGPPKEDGWLRLEIACSRNGDVEGAWFLEGWREGRTKG